MYIYQLNTNKWKTPENEKHKKMLIIILFLILVICLIFTIKNILITIQTNKEFKRYQEQILQIQKKEEEKKARIEAEKERKRQEKIPKLTEIGKQNIENIYCSETKRAFLTFDDGPSSVTASILDILKQEKIPATFFVLGSRAEVMPEIIKRIYEEGHYIANHGYSHIYSAIYSSPQEVLNEFNRCNDIIKNTIGVSEYNSHLFRFPGGLVGGKYETVKIQAKEILLQNNILNIDWNALNGDSETTNPTIEFVMQRLQETTVNKNSVVILMHDAQAKKVTAEALPQMIAYLREQGYEFQNFYKIIK